MRTLYQFPISHYCEKTRWHLDHKGLAYQVDNLFPGLHRLTTRRIAGLDTLPVLRDTDKVLGDSTRIALYLEEHYPQRPLLPADAAQRAKVLELEERFDRLGIHVRRWLYGQLQQWDSVMHAMLHVYRPLFGLRDLSKPLLIGTLKRLYGVTPTRVAKSQSEMLACLELIEALIGNDPDRYLVGDCLTLADISAAALLAPLFAPPGTPWAGVSGYDDSTAEFIASLHQRPAGKWVMQRYSEDRKHRP